jgi:hypothetical protein
MAAIVGLIIYIFIIRGDLKDCEKALNSADTTIVYVPTKPIHDSIPVKVPVPYKVEIHDTIPAIVDTGYILRDYFALKSYCDTTSDSTLKTIIKEQICRNSIIKRKLEYEILREKQVTITRTEIKSSSGLYLGATIGRSKNEFGFCPSVSFVTRKPVIISANYDIINKDLYLTAQWRIIK